MASRATERKYITSVESYNFICKAKNFRQSATSSNACEEFLGLGRTKNSSD